jgi:hypothetical protein
MSGAHGAHAVADRRYTLAYWNVRGVLFRTCGPGDAGVTSYVAYGRAAKPPEYW